MIDFEAGAINPEANSDQLETVVKLSDRMNELNAYIYELEQQLKAAKSEHDSISMEKLPNLMDEIGVQSLALKDGRKVNVKDVIKASIPTSRSVERVKGVADKLAAMERHQNGFKWLKANGGEDLIKHQIIAELGKGEEDAAQAAMTALGALGIEAVDERNVHPQTLSAFVREKLAQGASIPEDAMNLYHGRQATIK